MFFLPEFIEYFGSPLEIFRAALIGPGDDPRQAEKIYRVACNPDRNGRILNTD
jgi:hypothetical protein